MGSGDTKWERSDFMLAVLLPMRNEEIYAERKIIEVISEIANFEKSKLVIVNSSSNDSTKEIALKTLNQSNLPSSRWKVIDCEAPGKTRAVNLGISIIDAELIMMMDTDAISSPGWLETCLEIFENPEIGLVCGVQHEGEKGNSRDLESIYKKYSTNRRIAQSSSSSIVIAEGSMCCFRKCAMGNRKLNENYNADDAQMAILCSRNNFRSIIDTRLSFIDSNNLSGWGSFTRRIRRGRGLSNALFRNLPMASPLVNPVNPFVFACSAILYLLVPWVSLFSLIFAAFFFISPQSVPILEIPIYARIFSLAFISALIVWPKGRSLLEGSVIMAISQASSLSNSTKDAWIPDRQRE